MQQSESMVISKKALDIGCFIIITLLLLLSAGCSVAVFEKPKTDISYDTQIPMLKKYYMKQKIWSVGDHFIIRDEYGKPQFFVKGKIFSFGDKLKFYDMNGNELAYIKQKLFSLKKQYRIYRNQKLWARVMKKITLFKDRYIVDVSGPDDYIVRGDFTDHFYTFSRNGKPVAFITKKWFSWGDSYKIEIVPGEDDVLILTTAIVIDMTSHDDDYHHSQT